MIAWAIKTYRYL